MSFAARATATEAAIWTRVAAASPATSAGSLSPDAVRAAKRSNLALASAMPALPVPEMEPIDSGERHPLAELENRCCWGEQ